MSIRKSSANHDPTVKDLQDKHTVFILFALQPISPHQVASPGLPGLASPRSFWRTGAWLDRKKKSVERVPSQRLRLLGGSCAIPQERKHCARPTCGSHPMRADAWTSSWAAVSRLRRGLAEPATNYDFSTLRLT